MAVYWYRTPVNEASHNPASSIVGNEVVALNGFLLFKSTDRGRPHSLFAFEDLGADNAVWLPNLTLYGAPCFELRGPRTFGWGKVLVSRWLAAQRPELLARKLL